LVEVNFASSAGDAVPQTRIALEGAKGFGWGSVHSLQPSGVLVMGGGDGWRRDGSPGTERGPRITLAAGVGERGSLPMSAEALTVGRVEGGR